MWVCLTQKNKQVEAGRSSSESHRHVYVSVPGRHSREPVLVAPRDAVQIYVQLAEGVNQKTEQTKGQIGLPFALLRSGAWYGSLLRKAGPSTQVNSGLLGLN